MEKCKHKKKIIDHKCYFFTFTFCFVFCIIIIENLTFRSPVDTPWPTCSGNSAGCHDLGQMELRWWRMEWRRSCGNGLGDWHCWPRQRCTLAPDI